MSNGLVMKPTVHVNGREWHLFTVDYQTADGNFATYIYALSFEHAVMMLDELKQTARVAAQVVGFEQNGE